ncbi:hypothetical protein ACFRFH_00945 [Leifsonia sp. NPDC056824]|uniref:hypothetical protein n=1 Tax=Leifsonia sp. NPDC056824 TaxID=3345953 RepID=UPI0036800562
MSDEQALARVRELEEVIDRLKKARSNVHTFSISTYEDAGSALWAGQKRNGFVKRFDTAKSNFDRISEQIGQAIGECKSKQRSLAFSINPIEHPILSAQAVAIALN